MQWGHLLASSGLAHPEVSSVVIPFPCPSGFFLWDFPVVKNSPEWVTSPGQVNSSGRSVTFSLWTGMFWDGISSIPDEAVVRLLLGRQYLVFGKKVYHEKVRMTWVRAPTILRITTPYTPLFDLHKILKTLWAASPCARVGYRIYVREQLAWNEYIVLTVRVSARSDFRWQAWHRSRMPPEVFYFWDFSTSLTGAQEVFPHSVYS